MSKDEKHKCEIIANVSFSRNLAEYYLSPDCPHEMPEIGREHLMSALAHGLSEANTQRVVNCELPAIASMMSAFRVVCELTSYSNVHEKIARQPFIKGGRKGGKKTADKKRKKAESGWQTIVEQVAKDFGDNPSDDLKDKMENGRRPSQDDVYVEISALWPSKTVKLPSSSTVKPYLGELSRQGRIPFVFLQKKKLDS